MNLTNKMFINKTQNKIKINRMKKKVQKKIKQLIITK